MPPSLPATVRRFPAYAAAFTLFGLASWIGRTFGTPSIDQILYHLQYSEGAAVQMGEIFLFTFVVEVLLFPLAFAAVAAFVHGRLPQGAAGWRWLARAAPPLALGVGVFALLLQFSAFSYAASYFEPDRFGALYVPPERVKLEAVRPRNLVLVYVESLEATYGDASLFGQDLLAPLHRLGGDSFARYRQQPGSNWTIAAMVATQCGLPLKVYTEDGMHQAPGERVFLPGATCLGDLLKQRGFHNVFLGGVPLSFAGKGSFLRDHGYDEVYGLDEWERAGLQPQELNEWGLYDSALLQRARAKLQQLHAGGQPFNLTLLTLDTHNPNGFLSPACRRRGARDFAGIVLCGSGQLADFVEFMRAQGYLRDTAVVIIGDHLAVPNPVYDKLRREPQRHVFNLLLAQPQPVRNTDDILPFDFLPTLVELAGFRVEGERLGLGYAAIGAPRVPRPAQRETIQLPALNGSSVYRALWREPTVTPGSS
jgi:phosphoglycerol transferase